MCDPRINSVMTMWEFHGTVIDHIPWNHVEEWIRTFRCVGPQKEILIDSRDLQVARLVGLVVVELLSRAVAILHFRLGQKIPWMLGRRVCRNWRWIVVVVASEPWCNGCCRW